MNTDTPLVIIDTHVHIYDCYDLPSFFESAFSNCKIQARNQEHQGPVLGVLLLTETSGDHWFQRLEAYADQGTTLAHESTNSWSFHRTAEDCTLFAQSTTGGHFLVGAGRQIATKEKFEVLALLTKQTFQDGLTIDESIEQVKASEGIPVIPWAFGKWWGTRGKMLNAFMQSPAMTHVFLGDNSSRPGFLPYPSQFTFAQRRNIRIFPGSDPLPIRTESTRPCCIGLSLYAKLDERNPGANLKHLLQSADTPLTPYFQHERFTRFIRNQIVMRMQKP